MFIRDQTCEWCNLAFVDVAQSAKPAFLRGAIDLQLDWYAMWRMV